MKNNFKSMTLTEVETISACEIFTSVKKGETFILCHGEGCCSLAETPEQAWRLSRNMALDECFLLGGVYFELS
jgi:hypothetical protein